MSIIRGKLNLKNSKVIVADRHHKIEKTSQLAPAVTIQNPQINHDSDSTNPKDIIKNLTQSEIEVIKRRKDKIIEKIKKDSKTTYQEKKRKYNNFLEGLPTLFELPKTGSG